MSKNVNKNMIQIQTCLLMLSLTRMKLSKRVYLKNL